MVLRAGTMISEGEDKRFQNGARDYAAYLESPEGRLRADLAFAHLQDFLRPAQTKEGGSALDLGCGTGATAVRLAQLGFQVTLVDSSQAMLDIARHTAEEAGVADRVTLQRGDASHETNLFRAASFDVVLCHNVLEYVDDPAAVLRGAARALGETSAILSIVVRNQAGEVFKAAIRSGDLAAAEANLTAEWGFESLYGGKVRLFTPASMQAMLNAASLTLVEQRGIRVLSDYLPPQVSRSSEYAQILALEKKLGSRPEFAAMGRYTQCLTRRVES